MGYEVRTAGSGAEALELTQRWTPQAVLLGIGMNGIDGLEVARRLRRACPDHRRLRLIAVTGYGGDDFEQETRAAGFDHHISKPAERERLEEVLRGL
jgi:CheY-like chemotaxis protein